MISYRGELNNSWVDRPLCVKDLSQLLHMPANSCLSAVMLKLREPESITVSANVVTGDGIPLGGNVEMTLRSNDTYTFKGRMRASGFPSYHFSLQAFVKAPGGFVFAAYHEGKVFGTDTPGDRTNSWEENGNEPLIITLWSQIRNTAVIEYQLHADISGVAGTFWDIVKLGLRALLGYITAGPTGAVIVLGRELSAEVGIPLSPGLTAGLVVYEGVILIAGPRFILPAIVGGAVVGVGFEFLIKHRLMNPEEIAFARTIFGPVLDDKFRHDKIWLTNLSSGGTKYTIPGLDGTILVNLDDAYDRPSPTKYRSAGAEYSQPGSVFAHELTHACQIAVNKLAPLMSPNSGTYVYHGGDKNKEADRLNFLEWTTLPWTENTREQQAHIVDDWYGAFCGNFANIDQLSANLRTPAAMFDPAFQFIVKCRAGIF